jgi:hypothetical protein
MMVVRCDERQFRRITELERELGSVVVAYSGRPALADLSDEELASVRDVEEELGLTLLVFRAGPGR